MKIEIGESLCYSYLRHVKRCWLVQANWKTSGHWDKKKSDADLQSLFESMRDRFDPDGRVFKKTTDAGQFLKQGEIDVVGVDQDGNVHAMEIAFHEHGLNYGGGVVNRVMKKLVRTVLILEAYLPTQESHLYFASPKVHRAAKQPLRDAFSELERTYPEIKWHLLIDDVFAEEVVRPTLKGTSKVADTSELFARSAKLLELSGLLDMSEDDTADGNGATGVVLDKSPSRAGVSVKPVQPLVRALMKTLLEDHPTLLDDSDLRNLMNPNYCKGVLGLKIDNLSLLRSMADGRDVSGHARYYARPYDRYYVCNHWWKAFHFENAECFLRYVDGMMVKRTGHPGLAALRGHRAALQGFLARGARFGH